MNRDSVMSKLAGGALLTALAVLALQGMFGMARDAFGATSVFIIQQGGTGASSFTQGWVYSSGGTNALAASTSPTVNYITSTSTTATSSFAAGISASRINTTTGTSTFGNGIVVNAGCVSVSGVCLTSNSGTVTNIATTYPVTGGPITTTGTIALAFGTTTANTWSLLQSFSNASTSLLTVSSNAWLTSLGTPAGALLAVDPNGRIIATSTTSGVTSVTGTYPIVSSGGATPAISIAFGTTTANSWSLLQNFANATSSLHTITSLWLPTIAGRVLAVDTNGLVIGTSTVSTTTANSWSALQTFTSASTTNLSVSTRSITGFYNLPIYVASSSWGAGTSTFKVLLPNRSTTFSSVRCRTNVGTLNMNIGSGSATTTTIVASTTNNSNVYGANNTFTSGSTVFFDIGSPASSPTNVNCTFEYTQ